MQHVPTGLCVVSVASRHGPGVYWVMSSKKILKMNIILLCKNIEKLLKIAENCDRSRLRRENTELKLYIKLLCKTYVPRYLRYDKISLRKIRHQLHTVADWWDILIIGIVLYNLFT